MANQSTEYSLAELCRRLGGEVVGDGQLIVRQVATLANARPDQLSFLTSSKYRPLLATTCAGAVVVAPADRDATDRPRIVVANPYAYVARVLALLNPARRAPAGIDPSASIHPSAQVDASATIGAHVVIGANAVVGADCDVRAGCTIGDGARLGAGCILYPQVAIYHGCSLGQRAIVHSGAVIGADGFGFAPDAGTWVKIPQIGGVVIGDDVEIGANTTIDRGALDDTVIEEGVKLDNQIQVAHNVRIGAHTVIAACTGIAGSTAIGKHCMIGGSANIHGHISIADNTVISACTLVTKSITQPGTYTAVWSAEPNREWLKQVANVRRLDVLAKRVRELEEKIAAMERNKP